MDMMKNWYQSKTIWGALIAVAASGLHLAGLEIGAADQAELADIAVTLTGATGGLLALYGRLVATGSIGGKGGSGAS
ncbi:hypothetical protein [Aliirhizobium smilacinae]|jgi:hypothetical protein|uniref:Uncharacterized protein n=1 Tax=Aliirhizobium smilacinae TaxID=1395944 RepID=A0A5C4XQR1_9HYPH|nr:hypothetical protein [Rhizobium smilacinae]TNM65637.1 hypothetical protein FHP24_05115 [Rhizobium smilacinae]